MCKYWHDLMSLQLTIEPNLHDCSPNPSWTSHTLSQDPNSRPCNLVTHQLINFLTSYNSNTCTITYSPNLQDYTPNPSWMYLIPCLDPSCPACHNNVQFPIMLLCMCKYWHDLICLQLTIEPNLHDCSPNPSWSMHFPPSSRECPHKGSKVISSFKPSTKVQISPINFLLEGFKMEVIGTKPSDLLLYQTC